MKPPIRMLPDGTDWVPASHLKDAQQHLSEIKTKIASEIAEQVWEQFHATLHEQKACFNPEHVKDGAA